MAISPNKQKEALLKALEEGKLPEAARFVVETYGTYVEVIGDPGAAAHLTFATSVSALQSEVPVKKKPNDEV
jgi:hypothetical protein